MKAEYKFIHAVMSAGKTRELARIRYNYKAKKQRVITVVPSTDNRHGGGVATARSGEQFSAYSVAPGQMSEWIDIVIQGVKDLYGENQKIDCVLIDEVQFFKKEDIFAIKEKMVLNHNIPVIAFGLKSDFKNEIFDGAQASLVVAEKVEEIETMCAFCNERAIMNLRFENGKPTREGKQVLIGDEEYKQVCHKHYLDDNLKI